MPCTSGTTKVTATSRTNPKTTDATTAVTIPIAADRDAWRVSSLMCADASYPVIVYADMIRPRARTNPIPTPVNPESSIVCVNTNATDRCWGTRASTATTTVTPIMCHHAETVLSWASRLTLSRFSAMCSATTTVKTTKIVARPVPTTSGNHRFSSAVVKVAAP